MGTTKALMQDCPHCRTPQDVSQCQPEEPVLCEHCLDRFIVDPRIVSPAGAAPAGGASIVPAAVRPAASPIAQAGDILRAASNAAPVAPLASIQPRRSEDTAPPPEPLAIPRPNPLPAEDLETTDRARIVAAAAPYRQKGVRALEAGQVVEAGVYFRRAVQIDRRDPQNAVLLGQVLGLQGHGLEAIAMFRTAIALDPSDLLPQYAMARELVERGDHTQAQEVISAILAVQSDHPGALYLQGLLSFKKGDLEVARERAQRALKGDVGLSEAYRLLGSIFRARGEPGMTVATLRKAREHRPRDVGLGLDLVRALLETGHVRDARNILERLRKEAPDDPQVHSTIASFSSLAAASAGHGRQANAQEVSPLDFLVWTTLWLGSFYGIALWLEDATVAAEQLAPAWICGTLLVLVLARWGARGIPRLSSWLLAPLYFVAMPIAPVRSGALEVRGMAEAARGNVLQAIALLNGAIARRPRLDRIYIRAARLFQEMRQYSKAVEYLRRALELRPRQVDVLIELGACYNSMREFDLALIPLKEALALAPENPSVLSALGLAYHGRGDHDSALGHLHKAHRLDEESHEINARLGAVYGASGNLTEARAYLERAMQLRSWDAPLHNLLGWTLNIAEDYDRAIPVLERAIELDPGLAIAYYNLAFALLKKGDSIRSLRFLDLALQIDPKMVAAWRLAARTHAAEGRADLARDAYSRILALEPGNTEARAGLERLCATPV